MVNRCLGTNRTAMVSWSIIIILWKEMFLIPFHSATMTPAEMYLPPSSGKYFGIGISVRSTFCMVALKAGSFVST